MNSYFSQFEMPQIPQKEISRTAVGFSPTSDYSTDEEVFLLPEFSELIEKELEGTGFSPTMKNVISSTMRDVETVGYSREEEETTAMEQEIINLHNMVQTLQDRERNLEVQLLEYYGLKQLETTVQELQNRLKMNAMEAQIFSLKIESLQAENRRLEAQASDYSRVTAELKSARGKIEELKKKMKLDGELAKQQLSSLHQRVTALQDQEWMAAINETEIQKRMQRLKDLEEELMDLRSANLRLQHENSELALKLESAILTSSTLEGRQAQALEAVNRLRQANENLENEIERLRIDRCADVEELVYLRWVNACLRYELRNYQPLPGQTVARDLSKTLSPKSEEKAKRLILEYANYGLDDSGLGDFDSEYHSSSQSSTFTDSELDDTVDVSSTTRNSQTNKAKFYSKLKRLVLGKDNHNNNNKVKSVDKTPTSCGTSGRMASLGSLDDMLGSCSFDANSTCTRVEYATSSLPAMGTKSLYGAGGSLIPLKRTESKSEEQQSKIKQCQSRRLSLDIQSLRNLSLEEIKQVNSNGERTSGTGPLYGHKRVVFGEGGVTELIHDNHQLDHNHEKASGKMELMKYANALKGSQKNLKLHRRSASFASF